MSEYRIRESGVLVDENYIRSLPVADLFSAFFPLGLPTITAEGQEQQYVQPETTPDVCLPEVLDKDTLGKLGMDPVLNTPMPPSTTAQRVFRDGAVQDSLGNWVQAWKVEDMSQEEVALEQESANKQLQLAYTQELEFMFDTVAQQRSYDNRYTCVARAGYVGPFQAEGTAFAQWMDACNIAGYVLMAEVLAGTKQLPTLKEFLGGMPTLEWPAPIALAQ